MKLRNDNRWTQTLWNLPTHEFRAQWGSIGCVRCEKSWRDFVARTFELIAPLQSVLHWVYCLNETFPNPPEHYETQQNMSFGSNGVDQVRSLQKNSYPTSWHELLQYLHHFSPFCTKLHAVTKRSQMHSTTKKCTKTEYRIQSGVSGAFVA